MKKTLIIALALLVAGASFGPAKADKKKKKKDKEVAETVVEVAEPVVLTTGSDSLSYAAGMMMTNGLMDYLQRQLNVDTAYMADFVKGFNQAIKGNETPQELANRAGRQIADQVRNNMMVRMKGDFTDTPDSIIDPQFFRGFTDALIGDSTVMKVASAEVFFKEKQQYNQKVRQERQMKAGRDYLAANAQKEGVITTPSGFSGMTSMKDTR